MNLQLIISDNCEVCDRAKALLEDIKLDYPLVKIEIIHLNSCINRRISITPALLINNKLFSYGDIDKNRLLKLIGRK